MNGVNGSWMKTLVTAGSVVFAAGMFYAKMKDVPSKVEDHEKRLGVVEAKLTYIVSGVDQLLELTEANGRVGRRVRR